MVTHSRNRVLEFAAAGADALFSLARARISLTPDEIADIDNAAGPSLTSNAASKHGRRESSTRPRWLPLRVPSR